MCINLSSFYSSDSFSIRSSRHSSSLFLYLAASMDEHNTTLDWSQPLKNLIIDDEDGQVALLLMTSFHCPALQSKMLMTSLLVVSMMKTSVQVVSTVLYHCSVVINNRSLTDVVEDEFVAVVEFVVVVVVVAIVVVVEDDDDEDDEDGDAMLNSKSMQLLLLAS